MLLFFVLILQSTGNNKAQKAKRLITSLQSLKANELQLSHEALKQRIGKPMRGESLLSIPEYAHSQTRLQELSVHTIRKGTRPLIGSIANGMRLVCATGQKRRTGRVISFGR